MNVSELIALLQTKPQHLTVIYALHSEYVTIAEDDITIEELCAPRDDGWVHSKRPDKPSQTYLALPGN